MFTPLDASCNQSKDVISPETLAELIKQAEILDNIQEYHNNEIPEKINSGASAEYRMETQMANCIIGNDPDYHSIMLKKIEEIENNERMRVNQKIYAVDDNGKMKK